MQIAIIFFGIAFLFTALMVGFIQGEYHPFLMAIMLAIVIYEWRTK